jgi:inner membrane protein
VLSYPPGTFIPIAIATHGLLGLALGAVVFDRPIAGLVAGLFPDADFLLPATLSYPLVHRGLTHTLLIFAVAVALVAALADSETVGAVTAGYASHLVVDVTTPKGIPYLYPAVTGRLYHDPGIGGHDPVVTVVFWVVCLGALSYAVSRERPVGRPDWR